MAEVVRPAVRVGGIERPMRPRLRSLLRLGDVHVLHAVAQRDDRVVLLALEGEVVAVDQHADARVVDAVAQRRRLRQAVERVSLLPIEVFDRQGDAVMG